MNQPPFFKKNDYLTRSPGNFCNSCGRRLKGLPSRWATAQEYCHEAGGLIFVGWAHGFDCLQEPPDCDKEKV